MKIFSITLVLTFLLGGLKSQEVKKYRELGVSTSTFNNFGITYRTGNENSIWRFNALVASSSRINESSDDYEFESNSFRSFLSVGKEKRKNISDKLALRYGVDARMSIENRATKEVDNTSIEERINENKLTKYSPGINLVLGFNYEIAKNVLLGMEVHPAFTYSFGERNTTSINSQRTIEFNNDYSEISYGLRSNSLLLTVVIKV